MSLHRSSSHRSRSRSSGRGVLSASHSVGTLPLGAVDGPLSPHSFERERTLRELLEREVREREMALEEMVEDGAVDGFYSDGRARDPRLKLSYSASSLKAGPFEEARERQHKLREREQRLREREYAMARGHGRDVYPRALERFAVGAGDADSIYPYGESDVYDSDRKYVYEHSPSSLEPPYPDRTESYRLARRHSRSPRRRIESYAEERAREAEEIRLERERERRANDGLGARYVSDSVGDARDRRDRRDRARELAHERSIASLGASFGSLSVKEREEMREREYREREREREALLRERERRHRSASRHRSTSRRRHSPLSGYDRARLGSPSRTALRSPLGRSGPVGSFGVPGSYATAPYSSTFGEYIVDPIRAKEFALERDRAEREYLRERELRDRDRHRTLDRRELEILEAGRFGENLALGLSSGREYDSDDEDRSYYHPRLHGPHAYYQQHFSDGFAEPVGSHVGGGAPRTGNWLDEFYRPVDVRSSKSQWLSKLQPPSYSLRNNPILPEARLKLEWIYGFKSFDVRNNLMYNNVGDIIYPVASVVVVYKHAHRIQRHFQAHNDEVRALAQHPINMNLIASGQVARFTRDENGREPHIAIWDSTDFSKVWVLKLEPSDKSIRALAFSPNGKYLASISNDVHHTIKLWDWETRTLLGSSRGDSYALFSLKWNHKDPNEFITVGKHHAVSWRFDGAKLTARKLHVPGAKNITFYSIAFSEKGYACLGSEDGSIYVFVDGRLVREFKKVHKGKIFCLDWFPGGLISGGGDGVVHILDKKLEVIRSFTFHHRITSLYVRGNHLLIGTQGAQIFEIVDFMDTAIEGDNRAGSRPGPPLNGPGYAGGSEFQSPDGRIGIEPIVQGHYDGELHGVATTPGGREIVTVGEDNQLCIWEMTTHRLLKLGLLSEEPSRQPLKKKVHGTIPTTSHPAQQCARAVAVAPNGKFIIVGMNDGSVNVYTSHDLRRIFSHDLTQYSKRHKHASSRSNSSPTSPHWIECMKYSPNGHVVAIGTHGAVIVLLDTRDEYRVKGVLQTHESFITNLDFSEDGQFLASTDGQYHLHFHQLFEDDLAQSTQVLDQRLIRDVKWSNQNCVLGFTVQGILETGESEGYLIRCLEVSPSRAFVVSGDDAGQVQLFRHPVLERGHQSHAYQSHAANVANVRWSMDEKYVISVGGNDNAICQWTLV